MKDIEFYSLKPKSYDISEMIIEKFINPAIGNLQVGTLTTIDIQSIVNDMIKKGLSYSSIKKVFNILNKRFKLAMERREVFYNPVLGVKLPQNLIRDISDIVFFNDEQIEKICKEAVREYENGKQIYRLGQAVILLLYTGVRIGEALALDLEDPNLVQKSLPINKNVVTVKNRNKKSETDNEYITIIQPSPKTKASNRVVPLNRKARTAVIELQKLNAGHPTLISTSTGKIPSAKTIDRMFRSILRQCGIQEEGIHTLRHTFASLLFRKKVEVKTVSEILGHASVAITYSTYIHLITEQKAEALDLLDDEDDSIEVTSDYSI